MPTKCSFPETTASVVTDHQTEEASSKPFHKLLSYIIRVLQRNATRPAPLLETRSLYRTRHAPASASRVQGLQFCITIPSKISYMGPEKLHSLTEDEKGKKTLFSIVLESTENSMIHETQNVLLNSPSKSFNQDWSQQAIVVVSFHELVTK